MCLEVERRLPYNPLKWWLRNGGGRELMALHEPLKSPRLGQSEYWRGLGAVELLGVGPHGGGPLQDEAPANTSAAQGDGSGDSSRLMVSLRVSRRCSARDVSEVVQRINAKAGELTIISGFISGGEREVLAALLANPAAKLIKVSPYALPHDYAPPVTLMPAIAEGRLAIIARGNSPEEISRAACLDYNARIIDIADKAAYALPGELRWLK